MAGFFDDLGKRLSETANDLGKKAEDTLEIQKRKSDIRFLGRANDRDYMDIGKIIFEKYRNGEVVDADMAAVMYVGPMERDVEFDVIPKLETMTLIEAIEEPTVNLAIVGAVGAVVLAVAVGIGFAVKGKKSKAK